MCNTTDPSAQDGENYTMKSFNICPEQNIIRKIKSKRIIWAGHTGKKRNAFKILVGKPEWKRPFGKPRRKWA
jgi:hypothetical protein